MADYFLVTRYVGIEVPERFPSPERHIVKIFDDPGALDGRAARHLVYFNGRPALHALPRRIAGRCRYGQSPQSARGAGKTGLAVGEPVREERDAP
jgi:hypothetical protein